MTSLISVLATLIQCLTVSAVAPQPPLTELEGTWHEPVLPGENPDVRYKITFTQERVTFTVGSRVLTGTFVVFPREQVGNRPSSVWMELSDSLGTKTRRWGIYQIEKDELTLCLAPETTGRPDSIREETDLFVHGVYQGEIHRSHLGRVPLTVTFARVKK